VQECGPRSDGGTPSSAAVPPPYRRSACTRSTMESITFRKSPLPIIGNRRTKSPVDPPSPVVQPPNMHLSEFLVQAHGRPRGP
jgi:hypothetical protein